MEAGKHRKEIGISSYPDATEVEAVVEVSLHPHCILTDSSEGKGVGSIPGLDKLQKKMAVMTSARVMAPSCESNWDPLMGYSSSRPYVHTLSRPLAFRLHVGLPADLFCY